jgi:hypothetical protein
MQGLRDQQGNFLMRLREQDRTSRFFYESRYETRCALHLRLVLVVFSRRRFCFGGGLLRLRSLVRHMTAK